MRDTEGRVNGQARADIHVTWNCESALSKGVRLACQLFVPQGLSKNLKALWAVTLLSQSQPLLGKVVLGTPHLLPETQVSVSL